MAQTAPKSAAFLLDPVQRFLRRRRSDTVLSFSGDGNTIIAAGHVGPHPGFSDPWDRTGEQGDTEWTGTAR